MSPRSSTAALLLATAAACFSPAAPAEDDDARAARQAELDRACEAAREKRLAPLRKQFVVECVRNKELDSREECEAFYADYGAATAGGRAPLFYDLPPCVKAFEYAKSERAGG